MTRPRGPRADKLAKQRAARPTLNDRTLRGWEPLPAGPVGSLRRGAVAGYLCDMKLYESGPGITVPGRGMAGEGSIIVESPEPYELLQPHPGPAAFPPPGVPQ